jgi:hypothetical protein
MLYSAESSQEDTPKYLLRIQYSYKISYDCKDALIDEQIERNHFY